MSKLFRNIKIILFVSDDELSERERVCACVCGGGEGSALGEFSYQCLQLERSFKIAKVGYKFYAFFIHSNFKDCQIHFSFSL